MSDHAERGAGIGSWSWAPQTGGPRWSDNLFRLFGLEPGSVSPSLAPVLELIHPADISRFNTMLAVLSGGGSATIECRILRPDGEVRHLRATVTQGDGEQRAGCVQDVTVEHRDARNLDGHVAVAAALDEWEEFEDGAVALLAGLATAMDLCAGVLWLPQRSTLVRRIAWHVDSAPLTALAVIRSVGEGGCGSPWLQQARETRRPVVSNQPAAAVTRGCRAAMTAAGIGSVIAIPAVAGDDTLAVLEFASYDRTELTDRLRRSLNGIGHEIGYFLDHRRGELTAPVLTPRGVEVLQLAARAMSSSDIAREMHVSPATVKRHFEESYARLGVGDRAAAVAQAMRQGLIS